MDKDFYLQYAAMEDKHWWFVGRRQIVDTVIRQLNLPNNALILEAGCGTGGNLNMLSRHGNLAAMEFDQTACQLANKRQVTTVQLGSLPDNIPFADEYDLIVLLDVLEHIDDHLSALRALYSQLKPGGWLLLSVPAYQFLWSHHDDINHHKRRYIKQSLTKVVRQAGYDICYVTYFNIFLFPVVVLIRIWQKLSHLDTGGSDLKLPSPFVNQFLIQLFASESYFMNRFSLPFGVSILLKAQKPK